MKLLYLTPGCFDKGGISRYARYQIRALREVLGEANVRVHSLLGADDNSFEEPLHVDFSAGGAARTNKASFVVKGVQAALTFRPDIIHAGHVNLSGLACSLAKTVGARTFLNVYGLEVWSGFRRDAAWGLKRADRVISDCHSTARYLEDEGLRPLGSVEVVWDCVDLEHFTPGRAKPEVLARYNIPSPESGVNLLTLGRLSWDAAHKGYERLLQVFVRLASNIPTLNLILAGKGEMGPAMKVQASAAGLGERVFLTGMVRESDLPDVYRSAHIFSLISDRGVGRGEGIPLTPLEAAACGVPILVGNQDGSQEAVVPDLNGYILDPFDLEAQAEAITALATREDLRLQMGRAARQRIEEEFSYPTFRQKHRRLLEGWWPDL